MDTSDVKDLITTLLYKLRQEDEIIAAVFSRMHWSDENRIEDALLNHAFEFLDKKGIQLE